jgi:hypothetical protein
MGVAFAVAAGVARGQVERVWLTHGSNTTDWITVNWQSAGPGPAEVRYGPGPDCALRAASAGTGTLHHVAIPAGAGGPVRHYRVTAPGGDSPVCTLRAPPVDELRVGVVANWHGRPALDALLRDGVHILATGGDNIPNLHGRCGAGVTNCTKPYEDLVDAYPELFRSVPFLPVPGNHDREIRPRGSKPPAEPVYDIEATAFRMFFALPDAGWMWHIDVPEFDVRLAGLDLNHTSDQGTTWQTCQPFARGSPQFEGYRAIAERSGRRFVVTFQNERNATMRAKEDGEWNRLFRLGTAVVTGFGHFGERAEVEGFPFFNTSLGGTGARYPDPQSKVLVSRDNYLLLTFTRGPSPLMRAEIKALDGTVLDRSEWPGRR